METVFVLNCGSSSIKFQLVEPQSGTVLLKGLAENLNTNRAKLSYSQGEIKESYDLAASDYCNVIDQITKLIKNEPIVAIGHRVVHGGEHFKSSILINKKVLKKIKECSHLAPLHNPMNALGIELVEKKFPDIPQVAVFDTSFHQTMPEHAYLYAIPHKYYKQYKIRRYGFHGTSHRYVVAQAAMQLKKPLEKTRFISAHLGNGCSICAVKEGQSIDTSMGFTPLEGLVMGQRSGDLDPSIFSFLSDQLNINTKEVIDILNKKSGLLGLSGKSEDMRILLEDTNNPSSVMAIEVFCYRLAKYIASYIVPLAEVDALIFTGGIGENAKSIREKVLTHLKPFKIKPLVIPTNEELLIAQDASKIAKEVL